MYTIRKLNKNVKELSSELDQLIRTVEKSVKRAPEGTLTLSKSHGTIQYYWKQDKNMEKGKYLSKKKKKMIQALAQKDYDQRFLDSVKNCKECYMQ